MDINQNNFWSTLPVVLKAIAEATFVAVDLEMTGIKSKQITSLSVSSSSMEQVYHQAKNSAEAFQIIQIGLTCIHYNEPASTYNTQSFNFYITPMFLENDSAELLLAKMVDRTVSFSYSSLLFLKSHGFQFDHAFQHGVCYLSRQEEADANGLFRQNGGGQALDEHVDIDAQDEEAREFYSSAKNQISSWLDDPDSNHFVNISNPHGGRLNRLQVGLIHQLILTEFTACRVFSRWNNNFMQVVMLDTEREQNFLRKRLEERTAAVARQTGFRFVIEALTGGDFAERIPSRWLVTPEDGVSLDETSSQLAQDIKRYEAMLKVGRPILVGHNQFYDLCFIYRAFIGPLPSTSGAFSREIHRLFPRIVDTKHLASRGDHSMVADDSLAELFASVRNEEYPQLTQDPGFQYGYGRAAAHQAGFDSWMTSTVFAKLAWKLSQDPANLPAATNRAHFERQPSSPALVTDADDTSQPGPRRSTPESKEDYSNAVFASFNPFPTPAQRRKLDGSSEPANRGHLAGPRRPQSALARETYDPSRAETLPTRHRKEVTAPSADCRSLLDSDDDDDGGGGDGHRQRINRQWRVLEPTVSERPAPRRGSPQRGDSNQIPDWDTGFWNKYGNKLRVANGVLHLSEG